MGGIRKLKQILKILKTDSLKLVSAFFLSFLFFHQMIALQKLKKCFLFYLKTYFNSRDIQVFVIFSLSKLPVLKGQMGVE